MWALCQDHGREENSRKTRGNVQDFYKRESFPSKIIVGKLPPFIGTTVTGSMSKHAEHSLPTLCLAAIGVVFGDIGTSPLYTLKEVFAEHSQVALTEANVLGAVSTIFWALLLVVTLKYVVLVLRADNRGEGGIMALLAMALSTAAKDSRRKTWLLALGTFGAALFYGDSIITPAITTLSAVEGLGLVAPALEEYVLPVAVAILVGLFLMQKKGTEKMGRWFGPVVALWFVVLALVGIAQIIKAPQILQALNPLHAVTFLSGRGIGVLLPLGAIVLALTGAEALYADMGHFGRRAIQVSWVSLVWPGLIINYLGQGALLLTTPAAVENPFYLSFPSLLLIPAVLLSTLVSIIASQAVISGAYSVTQQAIHLGMLPRMHVVHTSSNTAGQIYIPSVNWLLLGAVLTVCISFGSSSALASAYGIAVTAAMSIDTLLTFFVVRHKWRYPLWLALGATGFFLVMDFMLVAACAIKIPEGGWFPLVLGVSLFTTMWTWKEGRELLLHQIREGDPNLLEFVRTLNNSSIPKAPRTAVFLVSNPTTVPQALLHNIKHNLTLHQKNLIVTVKFTDEPMVDADQRLRIHELSNDFWQIAIYYGFSERPNVPEALLQCNAHGLKFDLYSASFFISRETVVPSPGRGMASWRESLFAALSRNAGSVVGYFALPPSHVIELGTRVHI
jgi:KUP system potassium uptake protein